MNKWPGDRTMFRSVANAITLLVLAACSGDSGGGDSGYDEARETYEQAATERTESVAGAMAASYLERLAVGDADAEAVAKEFEDEISGLGDFLCTNIEALADKAGSGDTKQGRLDDVRAVSQDIVQDGFRAALLENALAAPAEQRDQLLDVIGVKAMSTDGAELRGSAALLDAGLLDTQGSLAMPERGTDEHIRYERWATSEAPGFSGNASRLSGDTRTKIEQCASSA